MATTTTAPSYYIESGTGRQVTDLSTVDPTKFYIQSGTGTQFSGNQLKTSTSGTPTTTTPTAPQTVQETPSLGPTATSTWTDKMQTVDTSGNSTDLSKTTPTTPAATTPTSTTQQTSQQQPQTSTTTSGGAASGSSSTQPQTLAVPSVALQPGNTGAAVKQLQDYLVANGFMTQAAVNTGYGTYGPQTQAAVAALQAKNGIDNSTGVGYYGPRTIAGLKANAEQMNRQGQGTTDAAGTSTGKTGQPEDTGTDNGKTPFQNTIDTYHQVYKELGLTDVKAQLEKTLKEQQDLTNEMNDKIADVKNNPWLTTGVADKQIERVQEKYKTRLDTLSHFATLYDSLYKEGQQQAQFLVGQVEQDTRQAIELAQKKQDAIDALLTDNQVVEAGGRQLLINKSTGKVVADLGAVTPKGTSKTSSVVFPTGGNWDAYTRAFNNAIAGLGPQKSAQATNVFNSYIQSGNKDAALEYLVRTALANAPADQQNQAVGRSGALASMDEIQSLLSQAKDLGVPTNLVEGNLVNIGNSLGANPNPDLSYIGSRIIQSLITYRKSMTGVAFGPQEAADYKKVFPDITNVYDLNTAKIQALKDSLNTYNRAALSFYIGPSNYEALFGTPTTARLPSTGTNTSASGSTSSGNTYTITQVP